MQTSITSISVKVKYSILANDRCSRWTGIVLCSCDLRMDPLLSVFDTDVRTSIERFSLWNRKCDVGCRSRHTWRCLPRHVWCWMLRQVLRTPKFVYYRTSEQNKLTNHVLKLSTSHKEGKINLRYLLKVKWQVIHMLKIYTINNLMWYHEVLCWRSSCCCYWTK